MENTNERFDKMMRGAFSGFGTSASFTRRLMVRIEQEKEMARVRRVRRISFVAAIGIFASALLSLILLITCFRTEEPLTAAYWSGLWERVADFFSDMLSAAHLSTLLNTAVVCLAVFAVLSWDAVLKIFYSRQK